MIEAPRIDPIALSIGPLDIRWYGLMYLLGFAAFAILGRFRRRLPQNQSWTVAQIDDLLFYGIFGAVIGGRLGYVLFYRPMFYLANPIEALKIWEGGMSFHGGLLGAIAVMIFFSWKTRRSFWTVADFVAPLIPLGLGLGRIGNFINGELVGRVTSVPWAMDFGIPDHLPRHPSQLYQAGLEGILLFCLLWFYSAKPRPTAAVSGLFLIGYGGCRFIAEFFRQPDGFMPALPLGLTAGQYYSLPMILFGVIVMIVAYHKAGKAEPAQRTG